MTIELINVGTLPNDGTGDPLRVAFEKINNNFAQFGNSTAAAGSNTQVQYNDGGLLGANSNFTYNKLTNTLSVGNIDASIVGTVKIPFDYTSGNITIATLPANSIVTSINAVITTAFDDPMAQMTVGTLVIANDLLDVTDVDLQNQGSYSVPQSTKYSVQTQVILYVSPSSSTSGEGLLIFNYE